MKKWKTLDSKLAFDHKWFKVRQDTIQLPNGKILDDYFLWPSGDVAMVVPVTVDNQFLLVQQYKHGAGDIMIEFPAGYIDPNEAPEVAAVRELREETGYTSPQLTLIGKIAHSPTKVIGHTYMYLASRIELTHTPHLDDNEEIQLILKPYEHVLAMITSGEIRTGSTITAAFLACKHLRLPI